MPVAHQLGCSWVADPRTGKLRYGRGVLEVRVSESAAVDVLRKPRQELLPRPAAAVADALDAPLEAPPLGAYCAGGRSACIVICDVTRPVPNGLLLRPFIDRLIAGGIPVVPAITILVATGLHRPNLGEELWRLIGDPWVLDHVKVLNHDANDASANADLGEAASGTPVALNRTFLEADVRIVLGLVESHFMAGYSGGRKLIAPGIAGNRTIRSLHSDRYMGDPLAEIGRIDGNPLHREQLVIARMAGPVFAVNTVLDEERRLAFVNAGELFASHANAVTVARRSCEVRCRHPYDLIVTSAAGAPLDATYYQTVKAMVAPLDVLATGGAMLVVSACSEGLGSGAFRIAQGKLCQDGSSAFLTGLARKSQADDDEWQTQMLLRAARLGHVHLYTDGLDDADHELTGVAWCTNPHEFVREFVARRPDARVALIPDGPYVLPLLDQFQQSA